jgi:uncharacterized protein YggE
MRSSSSLVCAAILVAGSSVVSSAGAMETPAAPDRIAVVGEGSVETLPDLVEIDFRVERAGTSVEEAKTFVDEAVSKVLAACDELGIDRKSITATDLAVAPRYSYDSPVAARKSEGYDVSRGITVRLTALASFNDLVGKAIHAGVNEISRIEMRSSKDRELREQAVSRAIQDGKRQAELIARDAGRIVDKVTSVATDAAQRWTGYSSNAQFVTVSALPIPEFRPGPITIRQRVFMTFSMR